MRKNILINLLLIPLLLPGCDSGSYTIVWENYDGTTLEKDTDFIKGEMPKYDGATPTKPSTNTEVYTFAGWSPEVTRASGNQIYVATFTESVRKYTITWDTGTTTVTKQYDYNETPTYDGEDPYKEMDEQYIYTFTGWSEEFRPVTQNKTYIAQFDKTDRLYTVTWDIDGNKETEEFKYLEFPNYGGGEVNKPADEVYWYRFTGWTPTRVTVKEDTTYTAVFEPVNVVYHVEVLINDKNKGSVMGGGGDKYGTPWTIIATPKTGYAFTGWYENDQLVSTDAEYHFTLGGGDRTFTAIFALFCLF